MAGKSMRLGAVAVIVTVGFLIPPFSILFGLVD